MIKKNQITTTCLMLCVLALAACSADPGSGDGSISTRTNPFNGETGVDPSIVIRAAFNRDMLINSFNTGSFTLSSSAGIMAGTVTYDAQYKSASFTPTGGLSFATSYTATLGSTITDQRGGFFPGYSWTFTTRGNGWGIPQLVENDDVGSARNAQIVVETNGKAIVVWQQSDGTRDNIWANSYTPGSGWGAAVLIETDNTGTATDPRVAIDSSGNAIAVWHQSDGSRYNIWSNRYTVGSGWGTAVKLEFDDYLDAKFPQLAMDSSGNAMAVWSQTETSALYPNIWANYYTVGSGWGTAVIIETDESGDAVNTDVMFDGSGNALAVWQQFDGIRYNIWANRYINGSVWGTATLIESDDTADASWPQVGVDNSGNAIAVWQQSDGSVIIFGPTTIRQEVAGVWQRK